MAQVLKVIVPGLSVASADKWLHITGHDVDYDVDVSTVVAASIDAGLFTDNTVDLVDLLAPYIDSFKIELTLDDVWAFENGAEYEFEDKGDLSFVVKQRADLPELSTSIYDRVILVNEEERDAITLVLKNPAKQ
mgnify:FL=1